MAQSTRTGALEYRYHPEADIHEFIFCRANAYASDEFIEHLEHVYAYVAPDSVVRLLIDFRPAGLPPMLPFISAVRRFVDALPFHPEAHVAFLMKPDLLFTLGRQLVGTLRWQHMKSEAFFPGTSDEHHAALMWLAHGEADAVAKLRQMHVD